MLDDEKLCEVISRNDIHALFVIHFGMSDHGLIPYVIPLSHIPCVYPRIIHDVSINGSYDPFLCIMPHMSCRFSMHILWMSS